MISSAFLLLLIPILDNKLKVTDSEKRDNQQNPINDDKFITIETSMEGESEHISTS